MGIVTAIGERPRLLDTEGSERVSSRLLPGGPSRVIDAGSGVFVNLDKGELAFGWTRRDKAILPTSLVSSYNSTALQVIRSTD